jgi:ATP-dependent DNA helicase RecQ
MESPIHSILQQFWGFASFRPVQEDIINAVLKGEDVLALLPTGGGKSLCYQVPAMAKEGLCVVVSPLIALMKDQVESLERKNIPALMIYSGMKRHEVELTLRKAISDRYKFLYVSPERLETKLFLEYLPGMSINLLAVDEAHCISQWGYDFRPPYLRIAALRRHLPGVPVLALTASATPEVQDDICEKLLFKQPRRFRKSFLRPNISYSVDEVDAKINKALEILSKVPGSGIVYCKSRRRTQEVCDLLKLYGVSAQFYHAGLSNNERHQRQQEWIQNKTRVMVCTNAFGMGIDKPDVRTVIHYDAPDCLENYYQEAGRAGRDEQKAYAVLLYQAIDPAALLAAVEYKFPPEETIKDIYFAIGNYLQLAAGAGQGQYFDFELNSFTTTFKFDVLTVMSALRVLEQEDMAAYNEAVMLPATVRFTTNKQTLYDFEERQPLLEPLIKILLRTYAGIYDYPVFISEKNCAFLLKKPVGLITEQLHQLHRFGIIEYNPVKDEPQLYFIKNRLHENNFSIDSAYYQRRKKQYEERLDKMLAYLDNKSDCRSTILSLYFGDADVTDCGVCDTCLKKKRTPVNGNSMAAVKKLITSYLQQHTTTTAIDLRLLAPPGVTDKQLWKVIDHLTAEEEIYVTPEGYVRLRE